MEKLQDEDEGTYTFQLQDGKATGHSTLVLIGDGKNSVEHQLKDSAAPLNVEYPWHKSSHMEVSRNCLLYFKIGIQFSVNPFHSISFCRNES